MGKSRSHMSPGRVVFIALLCTVIIGTALLALPISQMHPVPLVDNFFIAVSATTVTGLVTVPLSHYSVFGHTIIMILMQLGGLGLVTLTLFVISLFVDMGLATQILAGQILDMDAWKNAKKLLKFITGVTVVIEALGALIIHPHIAPYHSGAHAWLYSLFHSISSFCNAGITLLPHSMPGYNTNVALLGITTLLMLLGGFGFITLHELVMRFIERRRTTVSLQSRITLTLNFGLIAGAIILFFLLERNSAFSHMSTPIALLNSVFNAIAIRSTGFLTVSFGNLQLATLFAIMVFSFIGSSPGSTGSGIKTTTFALFCATIKAAITGRTVVTIKGRSIPKDQVYKAVAIVSLSMAWILITTFCLLITENDCSFIDVLLEASTSFTTLGISTGITPYLSIVGKCFITTSMIVGRVGSLSLILALRPQHYDRGQGYTLPEERVMMS